MDSAGTGFGDQGGRSKMKASGTIRYITDLGFTDDMTEKIADAAELDEVNYIGYHNPSNNGDRSSDKYMGIGCNQVNILADQRNKFSG